MAFTFPTPGCILYSDFIFSTSCYIFSFYTPKIFHTSPDISTYSTLPTPCCTFVLPTHTWLHILHSLKSCYIFHPSHLFFIFIPPKPCYTFSPHKPYFTSPNPHCIFLLSTPYCIFSLQTPSYIIHTPKNLLYFPHLATYLSNFAFCYLRTIPLYFTPSATGFIFFNQHFARYFTLPTTWYTSLLSTPN